MAIETCGLNSLCNSEEVAAEAEEAIAQAVPALSADNKILELPVETDAPYHSSARRVQSFFRAAVLTSYASRCAISGLAVRELLVASHIIPWSNSIERRADPTNGLCLNALFDRAFDRGLITIDEDHRVVVSRQLSEAAERADLCMLDSRRPRPENSAAKPLGPGSARPRAAPGIRLPWLKVHSDRCRRFRNLLVVDGHVVINSQRSGRAGGGFYAESNTRNHRAAARQIAADLAVKGVGGILNLPVCSMTH